jgi:glutamate carboxypeptidase
MDQLNWIDSQKDRIISLVTDWCEINSGSRNLAGLAAISSRLQSDFAALGGAMQEIDLPPEITIDNSGRSVSTPLGKAISIRKRPDAPVQVFLGIHMDTVYGLDHSLQHVRGVDAQTINGPGAADAKGGLCVMLIALEAFERSEFADRLGWEILINPDEELGSPGSADLLKASAGRNHLGMVFEPGHADGALVGERKGSGNFTVVVRGRSAHAGRDFHHGRNAIHSAAELVVALEEINRRHDGVTVNVGRIDGGGPTNIVPDLAIVRFNVRVPAHHRPEQIIGEIQRAVDQVARHDGIRLELTGGFNSPPRPMDPATTRLYEQLAACGAELGLNIAWHSSGGVSDANKLSAAGLPVIDSLGPAGGNLHSAEEFMLTDTLTQKAKLSALLLSRLATGEIPLPRVIGR